MERVVMKCPVCGELNYKNVNNDLYKCSVCNSHFFHLDSDEVMTLKEAQICLSLYQFDKADQLYQNILINTNDEKIIVMALFGRILAYFGVNYIKDFNGNLILTFTNYDPRFKSIKETSFYQKLKENKYYELYEDKINQLDKEYERINGELNKTPLYDVFICTKISLKSYDNPTIEGRTEDSAKARMIHDELTRRGLNVFYSDIDLRGINYDAQIYSALERSKNIVVVASKKEYLESVWVQSEWQRWLHFIKQGVKQEKSFYLFMASSKEFELPLEISKIQKFYDTLILVNNVFEKSQEHKRNQTHSIEKELEDGYKFLKQKQYSKAMTIFRKQLVSYNKDYRPWLGVVDVMIANNTPASDKGYQNCFEWIFKLCDDEKIRNNIAKKYKRYINVKLLLKETTVNKEELDELFFKAEGTFKHKDYQTAFEIFEVLASNNYTKANYYLGNIYFNGYVGERNLDLAIKHYSVVANNNHTQAQYELGSLYLSNRKYDPNYTEAFKWLNQAVKNGHKDAAKGLAYLYSNGFGVAKDQTKADELLDDTSTAKKIKKLKRSINRERVKDFMEVITTHINWYAVSMIILQALLLLICHFCELKVELLLIEPLFMIITAKCFDEFMYTAYDDGKVYVGIIQLVMILLYNILFGNINIILLIFILLLTAVVHFADGIGEDIEWRPIVALIINLVALLVCTKLTYVVVEHGKWNMLLLSLLEYAICMGSVYVAAEEEERLTLVVFSIVMMIFILVMNIIILVDIGISVLLLIVLIIVSLGALVLTGYIHRDRFI